MILWRRRRPRWSREDFLRASPLRNPGYAFETTDQGVTRVLIPRRRGAWADLIARWTRLPEHRTVELDAIGTRVLQWCDGRTTVREIIRKLGSEYRLDIRAAEVSFVNYLDTLTRRGIVGLKIAAGPPGKRKKT